MMFPARMKKGTARSGKELMELSIRSALIMGGMPKVRILTIEENSIAVGIWIPRKIKTTKRPNRRANSMPGTPLANAAV